MVIRTENAVYGCEEVWYTVFIVLHFPLYVLQIIRMAAVVLKYIQ